ncbi:hypothetical protein ONS95_009136 [Cadophora gregata]|uniref:uncharacterized protein n=1 Tax=Cadophora gregata TaxID=51156 RepID=UPI0026DBA82D|nr:uncharacterized protein ONS95_009136 [Cadophora gregata]KAK0124153.1 hypothetical protein ONS95_009136 [Cadophora gregata]KAK0130482.1 hypothetical protein ONS96_001001 [Cadophora gregata f. sp. sojae]
MSSSAFPTSLPQYISDMSHDDDSDPSKQLHQTLRESITRNLSSPRRPLLTHLNADTTWLLSLPYPESAPSKDGRVYYHILIDPWLRGGQSDVAKFFSQQWHVEESAVQTIAELEDVVRGIEDVAKGQALLPPPPGGYESSDSEDYEEVVVEKRRAEMAPPKSTKSPIDVILVSHEFTDHMHKETLLEAAPSIPVFAATKAAVAIKSWKHFDSVAEIPRFGGDWRESSTSPLPGWVSVSRVAYPGKDLLYYHSAVMVTFPSSEPAGGIDGEAEAVIYTPHGISPSDLAPVATASPAIKTLALLHGLQDIRLGAQLNMGAHNGLKVQRLLGAKYWVGTHDEVKRGGGIVSWFLDRKKISLKEAIEREKEEKGEDLRGSAVEGLKEVRFEELGNGESLVLE